MDTFILQKHWNLLVGSLINGCPVKYVQPIWRSGSKVRGKELVVKIRKGMDVVRVRFSWPRQSAITQIAELRWARHAGGVIELRASTSLQLSLYHFQWYLLYSRDTSTGPTGLTPRTDTFPADFAIREGKSLLRNNAAADASHFRKSQTNSA